MSSRGAGRTAVASPLLVGEGIDEHARQRQVRGGPELLEADHHLLVSGRRLGDLGAEEPVPPREEVAEVAVGLPGRRRVMDAMQVRRDERAADQRLAGAPQADIGVREDRTGKIFELDDQSFSRISMPA